jgi:glycosyltransferase involved in cell wall biosynthesis
MAHRIFINDNIPSPSTQRGVARTFRKIADGIIAEFGSEVIVYSPEVRDYGQAHYIQAQPRSAPFRGTGLLGINYFLSKYSDAFATTLLKKYAPSIVYSPYYGNLKSQAHQVFTVLDMMHELFPQYFSRARFDVRDLIVQKKRCFERATMLLAISESTAKDICTFYPNIDPTKIVVTPLGVDDFFFQPPLPSTSEDKPYFLYVGHRSDYKNFLRLLVAYGQSNLAKDFDLRVISPSGSRFSAVEMQHIRTYNLHNSISLVTAVNEVELQKNYAQAVAFVYPSEYEGFGLPILEAMASGTLVATSNTSSMPEVGGSVAFYFNPHDTCSITECLLRLASLSTEERNRRIKDGLAQARTFTWARCQQKVIEVMYPLI